MFEFLDGDNKVLFLRHRFNARTYLLIAHYHPVFGAV